MKVRVGGLLGRCSRSSAVAVAIAGGAARAARRRRACGTVTLNEQAWAGSTANTYVAKNVLEKYLGCKVKITQIAEIPVYQAMADGKTDAVLEDWRHVAQYKQYVDEAEDGRRGRPERRHRRTSAGTSRRT